MTDRTYVADVEEFDDGDRVIVDVGEREVGVVRYGGEFYALENRCPHDDGPVCEGTVHEQLELSYDVEAGTKRERFSGPPTITCPRHGWEYFLETGIHIGDAGYSVRTFTVTVADGAVYLET